MVPSFVWKLFLRRNWTCGGPQFFSEVLAELLGFYNGIKGKKAWSLNVDSFRAIVALP